MRITKPTEEYAKNLGTWTKDTDGSKQLRSEIGFQAHTKKKALTADYQTIGWTDCGCGEGFRPGVVLDPFCGSGTVLKVGLEMGLDVIGVDLKEEYIEKHCKKRLNGAKVPLLIK